MKRRLRQLAYVVLGLPVAWVVVLLIGGYAARGCVKRRAERRLRASMQAEVSIGSVDLGLVRGRIGFDRLHLERRGRGYLRIDIGHAETKVAPLGLVLLQDGLGELSVRGLEVEVSALGVLDFRGGNQAKPLTFDRMQLEDARFTFEAASFLPDLARITLSLERVVVGRTTLNTPFSWVFALRELTARLELGSGASALVEYRGDGVLRLTGAAFGDKAIEIPFVIPKLEAAREVEQLGELARRFGIELGKRAGKAYLWEKAKQKLIEMGTP